MFGKYKQALVEKKLHVDSERLQADSETFIHVAMIRLMLRRLA
jgi:hypothetical protein